MATTLSDKPNAENLISSVEPNVNPSSTNNGAATSTQYPTSSESGQVTDGSDSAKISLATVGSSSGNDVLLASVEKKMRRAERFGINAQFTEQEKRNSRAERFGTGSPTSETLKAWDASKKQARAERFGIPAQSVTADEDARKARLARFAPAFPTEEKKRKARVIRFSKPESESTPQGNRKGNTESEHPDMRPVIADVVTALTYLASQKYDPDTHTNQSSRLAPSTPPRTKRGQRYGAPDF